MTRQILLNFLHNTQTPRYQDTNCHRHQLLQFATSAGCNSPQRFMMESPQCKHVDISVERDLNLEFLEAFKQIAEPNFNVVNFNENYLTSIAAVYCGNIIMSGALIIDTDPEYIIVQCLCTRVSMHGLGYGKTLVEFLQLQFSSRQIHLLATNDSTNFYLKFSFEIKYRTAKCDCDRNDLKHLVWNFPTKKRRLVQIVTPIKKPSLEPGKKQL